MVFKASFFLLVTALVTFKGSLGQYPSMMYSPSRVMNDFQISWNNYGYYTRFTMTGPMDDFQGSSEGWMSIGVNNSTSMSGLNAVTCHFSFKENDNTSANFLIDHAYFTSESTPTYYFNEQIVWSKFIKIVNNVFMCTFYRLNDYTFWDSNYIKVNDDPNGYVIMFAYNNDLFSKPASRGGGHLLRSSFTGFFPKRLRPSRQKTTKSNKTTTQSTKTTKKNKNHS